MKKRLITIGLIISLLMNVVLVSQNFIIKNKTERYKISLVNSVIGYIIEINNSMWFMELEYDENLNPLIEQRMAGHDERMDALLYQVELLYATNESEVIKKFWHSINIYRTCERGLDPTSNRDRLYNVFQDFRVLLNGIEDRGIYGSRDFEYKISQFEDLIEEFLRSVKTEALKEFAEKEGYMSE